MSLHPFAFMTEKAGEGVWNSWTLCLPPPPPPPLLHSSWQCFWHWLSTVICSVDVKPTSDWHCAGRKVLLHEHQAVTGFPWMLGTLPGMAAPVSLGGLCWRIITWMGLWYGGQCTHPPQCSIGANRIGQVTSHFLYLKSPKSKSQGDRLVQIRKQMCQIMLELLLQVIML